MMKQFLSLILILMISCCCLGQAPEAKTYRHTNELINESSPYLLEHAHNPVNWYPWGSSALEKAKKENKPLVISIGYASCHWCHVMERETFSDTAVANFMNRNFVAIKVDREERPDIDQVYMDALQLIAGQGGWPLNAFALPDGSPFHAGTYFPRDQWMQMLRAVTNTYSTSRDKVVQQASALHEGMNSIGLIVTPEENRPFTPETYRKIFEPWKESFDLEWGGYTRTPKFPQPATWEAQLQFHYISRDAPALETVTITLDKMVMGGIYDHLNGGFARYSTDRFWKVPHFEKMLYDNGQMASLYAHAYQLTGNQRYADAVNETLSFIGTELGSSDGGFYSSLNADSEGEEGKFYVWTRAEMDQALGGEARKLLPEYFQVTTSGNWEDGRNILLSASSKEDFAKAHGIAPDVFLKTLNEGKMALRKVQQTRIRPTIDDKVLTSWNALALKGFVDAYKAVGSPSYLEKAINNAKFLEKNMVRSDGGLWRNYKNKKATIPGFLDDYAFLADAYIELYQVTFDLRWLDRAKALTEFAIQHFEDKKTGMYFYASDQSPNLVVRKIETADNALPSSNAVMAHNLFRLGSYYYHDDFLKRSKVMVANMEKEISENPTFYARWVQVYGLLAAAPFEVAVVGNDFLTKTRELQRKYLPTSLFSGGKNENLPLLEMKLIPGKTTIYVCRDHVCKQPVTEPAKALLLMETR